MAKKKIYAVRRGKTTGLFTNWEACKKSVMGYPKAEYKGFMDRKEAEEYLADKNGSLPKNENQNEKEPEEVPYAFVDGSYNLSTKTYGWGGFLLANGKKYILQGKGNDSEMAEMRNVAGEILGSVAAVEKALELKLLQLNIYYDYMGIEKWALGEWKANKKGTRMYQEKMKAYRKELEIHFIKVKGHSGVEGNELADQLAKESVGIG